MAKANTAVAGTNTPARSTSINLDETQGRNLLAAWRMIHWLYGGQVEKWNPTKDGVEVEGFSVYEQYDPNTIITDISSRTRRLDLLECLPILNGEAPEPYTNAAEITADTVQFYKGAVEEGSAKSPKYTKDATALFKAEHDLAKKRGPKAKTIRLDKLDDLDETVFENMGDENIAILQAALERVAKSRVSSPQVEAVSA